MIPLRDDNPSSSRPIVTVLLILVCTAVFLAVFYGLGSDAAIEQVIRTYGATPAALMAPGNLQTKAPTLVTSMFLHGGWLHLIGNMWYLWIFGDNIEDRLGHARYLAFYLGGGIVAALVQYVARPGSQVPTVGASGAIAAVLGAYAVTYPRARVATLVPLFPFFPIVHLSALVVLGLWFVLQFFSGALSLAWSSRGGVAWWAHIGG